MTMVKNNRYNNLIVSFFMQKYVVFNNSLSIFSNTTRIMLHFIT